MKSEKLRIYIITFLSALAFILAALLVHYLFRDNSADKTIKAGFIYVGDGSDSYTNNFLKAQTAIQNKYGEQVQILPRFNVPEGKEAIVLEELANENCDIIFTTSYGYGEKTKEYAKKYPNIEFCQATCNNANEEPVLKNYHTFMGYAYQGRYISGVVAGMKLKELIDEGTITPSQAKVGYVGAYPYAEVISGYTAFLLGIHSVVPEAKMTVKYVNSWGSFQQEKECAKELIDKGCVIISQHSDTAGCAVACEETNSSQVVYYVSYNESMLDVAPTTYLTGSKINWTPYITGAVQAVLEDRVIEQFVNGSINGNDIGAGFENDWIQMLEINEISTADGTKERVNELIDEFKSTNKIVFKGDYIGVNPNNPEDTIDLRNGYNENDYSSAPSFSYVLQDVISVE